MVLGQREPWLELAATLREADVVEQLECLVGEDAAEAEGGVGGAMLTKRRTPSAGEPRRPARRPPRCSGRHDFERIVTISMGVG